MVIRLQTQFYLFLFILMLFLSGVVEVNGQRTSEPAARPGTSEPAARPPAGDNTPSTAGSVKTTSASIDNPLGEGTTLTKLFKGIIDAILVLAIPIIVFFIIYAGFLYVTARGNTEQISTAHKALLYAIIGGVLILGASTLLDVIEGTIKGLGS